MTQYERGVDQVERKIQHFAEYHGFYTMRSAGSHGPADLIILSGSKILMVQAKLHDKLRDPEREAELKKIVSSQKCDTIEAWTAWKIKDKGKTMIKFQGIGPKYEPCTGFTITPLNAKQEKEYQARKKAYFAAKKSKKVMVPNTHKR